jgi:hypothetical protein
MKIDFSFPTQYGTFSDALHLPDDVTYTDEQIEAMKQERVQNWVNHIENPPPSPFIDENGNPYPLDEFGNPIRG